MNEPAAALAGLRVVEVAESPGAAFAGSLLADFGADVTVLEPLPAGSPLRRLGGSGLDGIWWPILARNKRSLGLDLAGPPQEMYRFLRDHPRTPPLLRRLPRRSTS